MKISDKSLFACYASHLGITLFLLCTLVHAAAGSAPTPEETARQSRAFDNAILDQCIRKCKEQVFDAWMKEHRFIWNQTKAIKEKRTQEADLLRERVKECVLTNEFIQMMFNKN